MLSPDPKRLRFFAIDLRFRTRRRVAVVLTYLVYFVSTTALGVAFEHGEPSWTEYIALLACTMLFMRVGLFSDNGPVKRMDEKPSMYRDMVLLNGLDDWSRYLYGSPYELLPPGQQHEVLLKYKVGGYVLPRKNQHPGFDPDLPDEREVGERNRAFTRALQILTTLIFSMTGVMINNVVHHRSLRDIPSLFMSLGLAAVTLPKAVILWNEPDPRELLEPDTVSPAQAPLQKPPLII